MQIKCSTCMFFLLTRVLIEMNVNIPLPNNSVNNVFCRFSIYLFQKLYIYCNLRYMSLVYSYIIETIFAKLCRIQYDLAVLYLQLISSEIPFLYIVVKLYIDIKHLQWILKVNELFYAHEDVLVCHISYYPHAYISSLIIRTKSFYSNRINKIKNKKINTQSTYPYFKINCPIAMK